MEQSAKLTFGDFYVGRVVQTVFFVSRKTFPGYTFLGASHKSKKSAFCGVFLR